MWHIYILFAWDNFVLSLASALWSERHHHHQHPNIYIAEMIKLKRRTFSLYMRHTSKKLEPGVWTPPIFFIFRQNVGCEDANLFAFWMYADEDEAILNWVAALQQQQQRNYCIPLTHCSNATLIVLRTSTYYPPSAPTTPIPSNSSCHLKDLSL